MGSALAQRASQREVYGAVTGHVSCADTNQPARLTSITLQAVAEVAKGAGEKPATEGPAAESNALSLTTYKTRLDGSFFVPRVKPGRYYVVVQKPGYLSPVAQFTREEIDHPNDETRALIAASIPMVTVNANESANVEVRLMHAGTIGGTVRFDDGTGASEMFVSLERRAKDGKWVDTQGGGRSQTDDQGRYRVTGLPAGDYRLLTRLEIDDIKTSAVFGGSRSNWSYTKYELHFYFGDTFRQKEAKVLKLGEGEEAPSADFAIPVAKLHSVSGSLVNVRSGRAINAGTVRLFTADDNVETGSAKVEVDEPTFRFDFVPEGEYVVRVEDARDVTREIPVLPKGNFGSTEAKEMVLHSYGHYEAPFLVQTDVIGVTLPMPEREAKGQKSTSASSQE